MADHAAHLRWGESVGACVADRRIDVPVNNDHGNELGEMPLDVDAARVLRDMLTDAIDQIEGDADEPEERNGHGWVLNGDGEKVWISATWSQPADWPATHDPVNHPRHYTSRGVECIDVVEDMSFCRGNAIKYLWRAGLKGDEVEDLKKARWYVDREIQRLEGPRA